MTIERATATYALAAGPPKHKQNKLKPTQIRTETVTNMNKAELVATVAKALGKDTSKAAAEKAVAATIDSIAGALKKGQSVQLIGFGTFKVVARKARTGVNPKTGEKIKIKASKAVKFGAGKELKSKLK